MNKYIPYINFSSCTRLVQGSSRMLRQRSSSLSPLPSPCCVVARGEVDRREDRLHFLLCIVFIFFCIILLLKRLHTYFVVVYLECGALIPSLSPSSFVFLN